MSNVKRLHPGPYPTPRPGDEVMKFDPIPMSKRSKVALGAIALVGIMAGTGFVADALHDKLPATEVPAEAPPATHDYGENPSGVPNSEGR
jgi:hypothetical protein